MRWKMYLSDEEIEKFLQNYENSDVEILNFIIMILRKYHYYVLGDFTKSQLREVQNLLGLGVAGPVAEKIVQSEVDKDLIQEIWTSKDFDTSQKREFTYCVLAGMNIDFFYKDINWRLIKDIRIASRYCPVNTLKEIFADVEGCNNAFEKKPMQASELFVKITTASDVKSRKGFVEQLKKL